MSDKPVRVRPDMTMLLEQGERVCAAWLTWGQPPNSKSIPQYLLELKRKSGQE